MSSGRNEVYVQPFPGPGGRVQVSSSGGSEPLWSHGGRELFYRSNQGEFVSAEVTTVPTFGIVKRQVLFSDSGHVKNGTCAAYAVADDDRRFLMVHEMGGDRHMVLVVNWFEELKRLTKERK